MMASTQVQALLPRTSTIHLGMLLPSMSRRGGGVYDAARQLSRSLDRSRVSVQVFSLADDCTQLDREHWGSVATQAFPTMLLRGFGYSPRLLKAILGADLDLIHCHGLWMFPSLANLQWSNRTGKPYVISPHGMLDPWALNNARWKKRLARLLYENAHLRRAACLHALNEAEAVALRRFGSNNPICIIPNGVALPGKRSDAPVPWVNSFSTSSPPGQRRILLFLGRLHPKKGLPNLLQAWRMVQADANKARDWALVIAGWDQNGHEAELRRQAHSLAIQDSVLFTGPLFGEAKKAAFENAHAFVLPSLSEGQPVAILEAWAYELPALMTPQCNLPEGFTAGAAMRTETDPESLARALGELCGLDNTQRHAMGQCGRKLVEQKFAWSTISAQMLEVYQWVVGGGPKPGCVDSK